MDTLAYKNNLDEVLERLCSLYKKQAGDQIFATFNIPSSALKEFGEKNAAGFCDYPDPHERAAFWDAMLKERVALEDDSIPSAYLSEFDQGLYGGLLGGDVQFMIHPENGWISSMIAPLLGDWSEFDSLKFDKTHPWFHRYIRQLQIFIKRGIDKFGISHFILIDGLNFVFELLGATATYLSLFESPEMVQKAINFAFDLNLSIQNIFFDKVPLLKDGTCSNMVQWIPGRIVSESVDPFHMTSVDYFEKWGREPVERMFGQFDGGVLHIHGNGRHLLEAVCSLKGLKAIFLGDDRGFPPAFDVLDVLKNRSGDTPLIVETDFANFMMRLSRHILQSGVLYKVNNAPDIVTVNRCMEKVRNYRI